MRWLSLVTSWLLLVMAAGAGCNQDDGLCSTSRELSECQGRSSSQCLPEEGCSWGLGCVAVRCWDIDTEAGCLAAAVCNWSGSTCSNKINDPCDGLDEPACGAETGCQWQESCLGTPVSCDGRAQRECETISHCWWEDVPSL